jgi:hypothetical protein
MRVESFAPFVVATRVVAGGSLSLVLINSIGLLGLLIEAGCGPPR